MRRVGAHNPKAADTKSYDRIINLLPTYCQTDEDDPLIGEFMGSLVQRFCHVYDDKGQRGRWTIDTENEGFRKSSKRET